MSQILASFWNDMPAEVKNNSLVSRDDLPTKNTRDIFIVPLSPLFTQKEVRGTKAIRRSEAEAEQFLSLLRAATPDLVSYSRWSGIIDSERDKSETGIVTLARLALGLTRDHGDPRALPDTFARRVAQDAIRSAALDREELTATAASLRQELGNRAVADDLNKALDEVWSQRTVTAENHDGETRALTRRIIDGSIKGDPASHPISFSEDAIAAWEELVALFSNGAQISDAQVVTAGLAPYAPLRRPDLTGSLNRPQDEAPTDPLYPLAKNIHWRISRTLRSGGSIGLSSRERLSATVAGSVCPYGLPAPRAQALLSLTIAASSPLDDPQKTKRVHLAPVPPLLELIRKVWRDGVDSRTWRDKKEGASATGSDIEEQSADQSMAELSASGRRRGGGRSIADESVELFLLRPDLRLIETAWIRLLRLDFEAALPESLPECVEFIVNAVQSTTKDIPEVASAGRKSAPQISLANQFWTALRHHPEFGDQFVPLVREIGTLRPGQRMSPDIASTLNEIIKQLFPNTSYRSAISRIRLKAKEAYDGVFAEASANDDIGIGTNSDRWSDSHNDHADFQDEEG